MAAPRIVLREQVLEHGRRLDELAVGQDELERGQKELALNILATADRLETSIARAGLNGERPILLALKPLADATPDILEMVASHRDQTAVAAALVIADKERERKRMQRWGWLLKHRPKAITFGKIVAFLAVFAWVVYFSLQIYLVLTGRASGIHS